MSRPRVKLLGRPDALDRVAFVTMPGAELEDVRVRFRPSGGNAWRCEACGRHPMPTCPHECAVRDALTNERKNSHDPVTSSASSSCGP